MRTSSFFVIGGVLILLVSCGGPSHDRTALNPSAGQAQYERDSYECRRENTTPEGSSVGAGAYSAQSAGMEVEEQMARQCLAARGWREVKEHTPSASQSQEEVKLQAATKAAAQTQLSQDPSSTPLHCATGFAASQAGYVVAVAGWAEQAGLHLGDRIVVVSGTSVGSLEEILQAYRRLPTGGSPVLAVVRQGQKPRLSLPCPSDTESWKARSRMLDAAGRGDWDGCIAAAGEVQRLAGYVASSTVRWELNCARAKSPSKGSPEARQWAHLYYTLSVLWLREGRYVPAGIETVRGAVLQHAANLRQADFPGLAADLEAQLREALAGRPAEPVPGAR
jgi:hypothetical protein